MNLFELFVKIGVDDQASKNIANITQKLGNGLKTAAKIGTAAVGVAATGITALTTAAVKNYAEYEQLVGGVDTLFKNSSKKVQQYADEAYRTAGLSANEYMETVTSFSASLLQSLEGDTEQAAEYADQAIIDMADNANKMGTSIGMIQNAYQGFAKQNYTMLDNLKLGYGGTQKEMFRLMQDAEALGAKFNSEFYLTEKGQLVADFADITMAIHTIQDEMGITGTTAKEAGATISGSVSSMKSAWSNLVTGIANDNADFSALIDDFVTTIVGDGSEENLGVFGNILPRIEIALEGAVELIEGLFPKIAEELPDLIEEVLPDIVDGALSVVQAFVDAIDNDGGETIIKTAMNVVVKLVNGILTMLPQIVQVGFDLLITFAEGIADALPELLPTVISVIKEIVSILTEPENLSQLLKAALEIIIALAEGIGDAIPELVDAVVMIIENIVTFLLTPENIALLINAALRIIIAIGGGLVSAIPTLLTSVGELILSIVENIADTDWGEVGSNIVDGLLEGLKGAWDNLSSWFSDKWNGLVGGVKSFLGIQSPSKLFKNEIGKNIVLGLRDGLEGYSDLAVNAMEGLSDDVYNAFDGDYDMEYAVGTVSEPYEGESFEESINNALRALVSVEENRAIDVNVSIDAEDSEMGRMLLNLLNVTATEVYA